MNTLTALLVWAQEQEEFDPDTVTPGVIGFIITFAVAVAAVLLIIDMVRRVRRVNYRQQARDKIAAEQAAAEAERQNPSDDPRV